MFPGNSPYVRKGWWHIIGERPDQPPIFDAFSECLDQGVIGTTLDLHYSLIKAIEELLQWFILALFYPNKYDVSIFLVFEPRNAAAKASASCLKELTDPSTSLRYHCRAGSVRVLVCIRGAIVRCHGWHFKPDWPILVVVFLLRQLVNGVISDPMSADAWSPQAVEHRALSARVKFHFSRLMSLTFSVGPITPPVTFRWQVQRKTGRSGRSGRRRLGRFGLCLGELYIVRFSIHECPDYLDQVSNILSEDFCLRGLTLCSGASLTWRSPGAL
ncbi:hypothetical protein TIFTF001_022305 [Ficus carica]|uniref:Uncharacterized protein n=1 Tax=Ficus carica TaxID=3494 RepID=A0AA88ACA9_FICCA|nr:hypothetical protein TIFTF001_022305 [Ficus carica]